MLEKVDGLSLRRLQDLSNNMALETHQQFLTTLERAKRPVILLSEQANADDFVSAFSVSTLLAKLDKPVDIVTSGGGAPKSIDFVPNKNAIKGDLPNIRKLTLSVDAKDTKVDELSYDIVDDELRIHLLPKTGSWTQEHVKVTTDQYKYDLIIAIGAQDLESFGDVYQRYTDFFFNTAIVNIDHSASNEHFGQLNLVDINAVSCSEVCHDLFKRLDESMLDGNVATLLLTGMIFKTKSFRSSNVTPKTLKVAGELIARGAEREEIVKNLYKTRTVETLRLWGRALARLKSDTDHGLVWTMLTKQDFTNAGAEEQALENIVDELISTSPDSKVAAVFYEGRDNNIHVLLHAEKPHDALYLGAPFNASGTREEARLRVKEDSIVQTEKKVITHVRKQLKELAA